MKDIFIVEDDALIAMLLEEMLEDLGYRVSASASVPDLEQALDAVHNKEFDAAILDVSLAGKSSLPIAKLLEALGKPYIFATGYGSAPEGSNSSQPVLQKPFRLSDLEKALKGMQS
jgi:DNA-binding response OmpR family regulator